MSSAGSNPLAGALRSVSVRLTAWYLLVFLLSTLVLSAAIGLEVGASVHQSNVQTVTSELAVHKRVLEQEGTGGLRRLAESPRISEESVLIRVVDQNNVTTFEYRSVSVAGSGAPGLPPVPEGAQVQSFHGDDGATWNLATTPLADGRFLQFALRDQRSEQLLGRLRTGLVLVWAVAILLGLAGGFVLTRLSLRPVQQLTKTARQIIASGDLHLRVPDSGGKDDLHELSRLFNGVLERNQALVQGMREALDNVAHDLRTPLTRLRTGAEMALKQPADASREREALADVLEESDDVLALLTSLMDITEAETGVMQLTRTALDLSAVAADCVALYADVAEERGVRVVSRLPPDVPVNGDRRRLQQAIANLLDNALKYTQVGGLVEVTTSREAGWGVLTVQDNGPGIAAEDLPRIWTRLFRADSSRSQRGLGLGLSFVKAIVEAHGGQVTAASPGQGSVFTLRLPTSLFTESAAAGV